jgi:hypothetical protein
MAGKPKFCKISHINPLDVARSWGILSPEWGIITPDSYIYDPVDDPTSQTPIAFKMLLVLTGGTIRVEGLDGQQRTSPTLPSGIYIPGPGYRVMSAGTSASDIMWFGGYGGVIGN